MVGVVFRSATYALRGVPQPLNMTPDQANAWAREMLKANIKRAITGKV